MTQRAGTRPAASAERAPDARRMLFVADLFSMLGGVLAAVSLHRPLGVAELLSPDAVLAHILLFGVFTVVTLLRLGVSGQYDSGQRFSRIDDIFVLLRGTFIGAAIAVFAAVATKGFFLDFVDYSRAYIVMGFGFPFLLLLVSRLVGHHMQVAAFREGRYLARALVIGEGERAREFTQWLDARPHLGLAARLSEVPVELELRDYMAGLSNELEDFEPDEVVIALEASRPDLRAAIVRDAAFKGIDVKVLPQVFENYYDLPVSRYEGIPVTTIFETPGRRFAGVLKHAIDRTGSIVGLAILSPFFAVMALLIWAEDRGPVIFEQERVGERGKRFFVRKFRTMRVDAEERKQELLAQNEAEGPMFKMRNDPRITRVGRFLRRTSLDELPQLWNVAFGEMSLVGPRPPLASEVDEYRVEHRRRLLVRPGMTGLWQVSGRSETTFDEMVNLDLLYIENWSFWLDAKILLKTVWVVVGRRGAY